ncbi:MAG: aspartate--tRNA ligase [Alphaproteobacteria bacterium]|nr:aspartate--tRNA ligase [Alphaproteobacteria bacterium]MBL7098725.1 aspartate--tRNA ligase [Alphaproteobacteria bacterium]
MHAYRTHTCGQLRKEHVGQTVRLSGWVNRRRDHGGLLFIDLRDHYGITQCVIEPDAAAFAECDKVRSEWVITITGRVVQRFEAVINRELPTGEIEVRIDNIAVQSEAQELPLPVFGDLDYPEETRLKYRFLDLRRERLHRNIVLRSRIIQSLRNRMIAQNFTEFQTPILTASSPEGARDFLVPSRRYPGHFYALPQAPQQFKQLIMVSGFDRYFQIAPCFRDEDGRADRSPGEFYQLDVEMSFVEQKDVFDAIQPVLLGCFEEFAEGRKVYQEVPHITYEDAALLYGTDKPDLRNPILLSDVSEVFAREDVAFKAFKAKTVRAIPAPGAAGQPRSFFDKLNDWARTEGAAGLGYIQLEEVEGRIAGKGPIAKFLSEEAMAALVAKTGVKSGDAVFFSADAKKDRAAKIAGLARTRIGTELKLIEENCFKFCWIVDMPMYEWDEDEKKIDFGHNPFSLPQYDREKFMKLKADASLNQDDREEILGIKVFQYDIVCNGYEMLSGAVRNRDPEVMLKAFEIVGHGRDYTEAKFGGMLSAFRYGAPPHGGCAVGLERVVMLLAGEENIREVTVFPMNQQGEDLLMNAPTEVLPKQLRELHIRVVQPEKEKV